MTYYKVTYDSWFDKVLAVFGLKREWCIRSGTTPFGYDSWYITRNHGGDAE